ncbi:MAG TPA: aminoglycoside phosphotransferase family protein [Phenylobacterium sp.]|jgi:streptomycin 6-kinase|uniref:aminoglycoside phosphotransferase family protein n=1 Tax=Phenylobacterium sp. TaxID=1871053 RepID=UPI002D4D7DE5|nr:aminoglycoside phosphotransferase family protein [Phenylobacterium sp.]HZZ68598.1 aminoglycoside phosphotransferase family protein [Phenylobacterium sp.]
MAEDFAKLAPWMARWGLIADGAPFRGPHTGNLLAPVRRGETAAMLKVAFRPEEQLGGAVLAWWNGEGAAPVLACDGEALLMLRGAEDEGLVRMARDGRDGEATAILCAATAALHRPRSTPPPEGLKTLADQFRALRQAAAADARFAPAWAIAAELLAAPRDPVVLHGDIHHRNLLDFGERGWLAIDGWGVVGERAYDYANILRNPDLETALMPGRMAARLAQIAPLAELDPVRLGRWTVAHAFLSAAWCVEDGVDACDALRIAEAARNLA